MNHVLHAALDFLIFAASVWIAVFGGIGAIYAAKRGASPITGMALGALLGPVGWGIVRFRTRKPGLTRKWFHRLTGGAASPATTTKPTIAPAPTRTPRPSVPTTTAWEDL